jgi:hypothetical protein
MNVREGDTRHSAIQLQIYGNPSVIYKLSIYESEFPGPECRSFALFGLDDIVEIVDLLPLPENEPHDARTVIENASRLGYSRAPRHDI